LHHAKKNRGFQVSIGIDLLGSVYVKLQCERIASVRHKQQRNANICGEDYCLGSAKKGSNRLFEIRFDPLIGHILQERKGVRFIFSVYFLTLGLPGP
jgi:hypothetical protein